MEKRVEELAFWWDAHLTGADAHHGRAGRGRKRRQARRRIVFRRPARRQGRPRDDLGQFRRRLTLRRTVGHRRHRLHVRRLQQEKETIDVR